MLNLYEKELQKTNKKESRIENVIKRKGNKLCVKWANTFLSQINLLEETLMSNLICLIMQQN